MKVVVFANPSRYPMAPIFKFIIACCVIVCLPAQSERDTSRDQFRHPFETLDFFGIKADMDVLEISPGGGWYTDVIAPSIKGTLYAGHFNPENGDYFKRSHDRYLKKIESDPKLYGNVKMTVFDAGKEILSVENESVDAVLTFRNVHGWIRSNSESNAFALFYKALKPGGVLGLVQHRAKPGVSVESMGKTGYVSQEYVVGLAKKAGFVLEASSEINANALDTKDHPRGVWTLPPALRLGDENRAFYTSIGESDRMTLRFRKPQI